MKKFGSWLDEDENVMVGGTTICECLTYCLTCKKNPNTRNKKREQPEVDIDQDTDDIGPDEFTNNDSSE